MYGKVPGAERPGQAYAIKYFSLMSGAGGFEQGIEKARPGAVCVGYSEIDRYACSIYRYHYGGHRNYGDATKINTRKLPDFNLLCAGFPCQPFSISGIRKGFEDIRGTLFFEVARVARSKLPRHLFIENVRGILSHDKGQTFKIVLETLRKLGYALEFGLLNSRYFGVPQKRARVFIVGSLGGEPRLKVFPLKREGSENHKDVALGKTWTALTERRTEESKAIRSSMLKKGRDWSPRRGKELVRRTDGQSNCLTATLSKEHLLTDGLKVRRLTPLEFERLQGFPDNWTKHGIDESGNQFEISDIQRYRCLGNAVTVNVVEEIARRLLCP